MKSQHQRGFVKKKWMQFFGLLLSDSTLTFSWRQSLLYKNQPIDLLCKLIDCFLYDKGLHHEINQSIKSPCKIFIIPHGSNAE